MPAVRRMPVIEMTILVWRLQRSGVRQARRSSNSTGKPRPPAMTRTQMTPLTIGSVANPMRLLLYREKPALLNAETAWNSPSQAASGSVSSPVVQKRAVSRTAPAASNSRLVRATPSRTLRMSLRPRVLASACALSLLRRPRRLDTSRPSSVAKAMIPNPPTWISARMTAWPNPVQYTGVSTMISPVTHTADVAVNRASTMLAPPGPVRAIGSSSSSVPTATATANPATTYCAGCRSRGTPRRHRACADRRAVVVRFNGRSRLEPVAAAGHGDQVQGGGGVRLELAAQLRHVDAQVVA